MVLYPVESPNLAILYRRSAEKFGELPAFATRKQPESWEPVSFRQLYEAGLCLATALIEEGVEQRDHVALLADNRFEWILADYGIQLCGAVNVPRGCDVTEGEMDYILPHCGVEFVFVENERLRQRLNDCQDAMEKVRRVVLLEGGDDGDSIYDLVEKGRQLREEGDRRAEERIEAIKPEDLFTLIYTSGTTGVPKGVMLEHRSMISQVERVPLPISTTDRVLSVLPVWHIFERVFEIIAISRGCCTYYSSVRNLSVDLQNVEPTFMGSAPRLWESVNDKILRRVREAHPVRRALFRMALFFAHIYKDSTFFLTGCAIDLNGRSKLENGLLIIWHALRWVLVLPFHGFFYAAVLERLRLATGGGMKGSVSGGGALPEYVDKFFNYIGIPVLEGYGLTETCPVVAVRTPGRLVIGTVGPLIEDTEVRIVNPESGEIIFPDDSSPGGGRGRKGEIHVRGPQVMRGYYKNQEATDKVYKEGWFNTGDLGMMTFNDCLKIMGRSKETIVLSSGENLEPVPIEMELNQSQLIAQCMVVGQDKKSLAALVVPSLEGLKDQGLKFDSLEAIKNDGKVRKLIHSEIRKRICGDAGFKSYERIQRFELLQKEFEVGDEMTSLFKLRRHVITEKYEELIEELYNRDAG